MEKIKTILDRKTLGSEYIQSKQNFGKVMKGAQVANPPVWKSSWFYGTVGVATVAAIVTVVTLTSSEDPKTPNEETKQVVATNADTPDNSDDPQDSKILEYQSNTDNSSEEPGAIEPKDTDAEESPDPNVRLKPPVEKQDTELGTSARVAPEPKPETTTDLKLPNIAGVTAGPITFRDFCDPVGLQVGDNVLIYSYTIQYRSCARDVTARIRGNLIPRTICDEIRDCGSNIEVTFSKIEGRDRDNNLVHLKDFSVVATM